MIEITNEDNMVLMSRYKDNHFDLAIVDPPYGIGIDGQKKQTCKNPKHNRKFHEKKGWDDKIPQPEYFKELFRVSKYQIIFGGNYFTEYLPPVRSWIFWFKGQNDLTMSDGELLWTNLPIVTRQFTVNRSHLIGQETFHPTEKPYKVYKYLLKNYAEKFVEKNGGGILDTHIGSGSIAIACHDYGFKLTGCELDEWYFKKAIDRLKKHQSQQKLF